MTPDFYKELLERKPLKRFLKKPREISASRTGYFSKLQEICDGYEEFMQWTHKNNQIPIEITEELNPSKSLFAEFIGLLSRYPYSKDFQYFTASYLTALMHSTEDSNFEINLKSWDSGCPLDNLGYGLKSKSLTIHGNAGDYVGHSAQNSQIEIYGSVGGSLGINSKCCNFSVYGYSGAQVGERAKNCKIYLLGGCGGLSSDLMPDTEIFQRKYNNRIRIHPKQKK